MKPKRKRKCKVCREWFSPFNTMQPCCSPQCALALTEKQKKAGARKQSAHLKRVAKEQRKVDRATKERLKSKAKWLSECQTEFNRYIRARDYGKPCVSCSDPLNAAVKRGGKIDSGHYRSIGSARQHRFNEKNCHAQCIKCNRYLSSNTVEYRKELINRIGLESVEALENDNTIRKYSIEELKEIKMYYRALANSLQNEMEG